MEKMERAKVLRAEGKTIKETQAILKAEFGSELNNKLFKSIEGGSTTSGKNSSSPSTIKMEAVPKNVEEIMKNFEKFVRSYIKTGRTMEQDHDLDFKDVFPDKPKKWDANTVWLSIALRDNYSLIKWKPDSDDVDTVTKAVWSNKFATFAKSQKCFDPRVMFSNRNNERWIFFDMKATIKGD